jgi:hypothetical protein
MRTSVSVSILVEGEICTGNGVGETKVIMAKSLATCSAVVLLRFAVRVVLVTNWSCVTTVGGGVSWPGATAHSSFVVGFGGAGEAFRFIAFPVENQGCVKFGEVAQFDILLLY